MKNPTMDVGPSEHLPVRIPQGRFQINDEFDNIITSPSIFLPIAYTYMYKYCLKCNLNLINTMYGKTIAMWHYDTYLARIGKNRNKW